MLWLARNKDERLYVYDTLPIRFETLERFQADTFNYMEINQDLYPQVTWNNSPIELKPKEPVVIEPLPIV